MKFVEHSKLNGLHAPFSPSQPSWLNYTDERAMEVYSNKKASELGTRLHAWAKEAIDLGIKMPRSKKTLYAYINDAIGFHMNTEVVLFYSPYFFGTADAISFDEQSQFLRIHDLKTGQSRVHIEQVMVYAALFCLEYKYSPDQVNMELRIYQNDDVEILVPNPDDIYDIMEHIKHLNELLLAVEGDI